MPVWCCLCYMDLSRDRSSKKLPICDLSFEALESTFRVGEMWGHFMLGEPDIHLQWCPVRVQSK